MGLSTCTAGLRSTISAALGCPTSGSLWSGTCGLEIERCVGGGIDLATLAGAGGDVTGGDG